MNLIGQVIITPALHDNHSLVMFLNNNSFKLLASCTDWATCQIYYIAYQTVKTVFRGRREEGTLGEGSEYARSDKSGVHGC